jgi:hypothetical protein
MIDRELTDLEKDIIILFNEIDDALINHYEKINANDMKAFYKRVLKLRDAIFEPQSPNDSFYITLDEAKKGLIYFLGCGESQFKDKT